MVKDDNIQKKQDVYLSKTLTFELKERQSVRATFRLSEGCIDAISIVATQMGIKQKSLFDHLAEDMDSLKSIAREIKQMKIKKHGRIQKTFVISRKSLSSLDEFPTCLMHPGTCWLNILSRDYYRLLVENGQSMRHEKNFL